MWSGKRLGGRTRAAASDAVVAVVAKHRVMEVEDRPRVGGAGRVTV
jgi:hypothetical protein